MVPLLEDCSKFYEEFNKESEQKTGEQEITQMNRLIDDEEARAHFFFGN